MPTNRFILILILTIVVGGVSGYIATNLINNSSYSTSISTDNTEKKDSDNSELQKSNDLEEDNFKKEEYSSKENVIQKKEIIYPNGLYSLGIVSPTTFRFEENGDITHLCSPQTANDGEVYYGKLDFVSENGNTIEYNITWTSCISLRNGTVEDHMNQFSKVVYNSETKNISVSGEQLNIDEHTTEELFNKVENMVIQYNNEK